ncbi:hypothetical protein AB0L06_43480 [Spirillospora sp. NPDC052269]
MSFLGVQPRRLASAQSRGAFGPYLVETRLELLLVILDDGEALGHLLLDQRLSAVSERERWA